MSMIQAKATLVLQDMAAPAPPGGGILQIIISILQSLLGGSALCGLTPAQATARINRPRILEKMSIRNAIRQQVGSFSPLEPHLFQSILSVGSTLSVDDTTAMYEEMRS